MSTWMKKTITAEGVTEFQPGPHLSKLGERFGGSGAAMLLLDVSGSMWASVDSSRRGTTRLEAAIVGCRGFIEEAIGGGYEVGLMLWSHVIEAVQEPTPSGAEALLLLEKKLDGGGNQLTPALQMAGEILLNIDVSDRVIAIFTDGELLSSDEASARVVSSQLGAKGVRILTLGLGEESAESLASIATEASAGQASTTGETLSEDIKGMARGLMRRKK